MTRIKCKLCKSIVKIDTDVYSDIIYRCKCSNIKIVVNKKFNGFHWLEFPIGGIYSYKYIPEMDKFGKFLFYFYLPIIIIFDIINIINLCLN